MESFQQYRTPQQPNFRAVPLNFLNLAPQDPSAQVANNADLSVYVDINGFN